MLKFNNNLHSIYLVFLIINLYLKNSIDSLIKFTLKENLYSSASWQVPQGACYKLNLAEQLICAPLWSGSTYLVCVILLFLCAIGWPVARKGTRIGPWGWQMFEPEVKKNPQVFKHALKIHSFVGCPCRMPTEICKHSLKL